MALKKLRKSHIIAIVSIVLVVAVVITSLAVNHSVLSSRVTFNSVDEMRDTLEGVYVNRDDLLKVAMAVIEIEGDKAIWHYRTSGELNPIESDISFYPSRGYIKTRRTDRTSQNGGVISFSSEDRTFIIKSERVYGGERIYLLDDADREWRRGSLSELEIPYN
ncbi:MAG: hypothetical protein FWG70_05375 [Oscillospiraceae bacterium]|nr:hypothetical protein [Oscillospiraceae bacterium]